MENLETGETRSHALVQETDKKVRSRNMVAGKARKDGLKSVHEDQ